MWQLELIFGVACVLLGISLTAKPFDSLSVLIVFIAASFLVAGVSEILSSRAAPGSKTALIAGIVWIALGIIVLAWPGITIGTLAILVGISMLVGGIGNVADGIRGTADDRLISTLNGLSGIVFGVLALSWPDVTVLVIALLVGPRIILFGLARIASALSRGDAEPESGRSQSRSRWPRWLRVVGSGGALVLALGLLAISAWLHDKSPSVDAFYDAPSDVPSVPGQLIRSERYDKAMPAGGIGYRILYTTTNVFGNAAIGSAVVVIPANAPSDPQPLLAWLHGTTGIQRQCAPSILGFEAGAFFVDERIVQQGWTLVAPDYVGLGSKGPHAYLIGEGEARSALDAIRAARQMPELRVTDETIVWGHSQGGHATLWTGMLASSYAPDAHVVGVAALAPASDLEGLISELKDGPVAATMLAYVISSYSNIYSDVRVDDYVRPAARTFVRETADRCLGEPAALVSVIGALPFEGSIFEKALTTGVMGDHVRANVPSDPIDVPLLVAQGSGDQLVLPAVQRAYVDGLCASGQKLDYWTYKGLDHVPLVELDSPLIDDLFSWTEGVLAGTVNQTGCTTVDH